MNLTDYKRKKGTLPKEDLGTLFVFTSNREGVSEITEHLIWEIRKSGRRTYPLPEMNIYEYKIEESPYLVEIAENEKVSCDKHLFSIFGGDPWSGSTFASLDIRSLESEREKERVRILKEYQTQSSRTFYRVVPPPNFAKLDFKTLEEAREAWEDFGGKEHHTPEMREKWDATRAKTRILKVTEETIDVTEDNFSREIKIKKSYRNGTKEVIIPISDALTEDSEIESFVLEWCDRDPSGSNYGYNYKWEIVKK